MTAVWTIAGYGLREALRRKVFVVVCMLTIAFLVLYWIGTRYAFHHINNVVPPEGIDPRTFAGAFLFGMAMFGTLFLGVVLAIFLTLGVVRGGHISAAKWLGSGLGGQTGMLSALLVSSFVIPAWW